MSFGFCAVMGLLWLLVWLVCCFLGGCGLRCGWFWCSGSKAVWVLVWVKLISLGVADFALFGGVMVLTGWVCCNTGLLICRCLEGVAGFDGWLLLLLGFAVVLVWILVILVILWWWGFMVWPVLGVLICGSFGVFGGFGCR